jgi:DNA mismatch repair protein MutL
MSKIRKLPQNVVNKIAAGEVVERPASVLKELLENALDAAATNVIVDIEEGGKKLIRVQDNGEGMDEEDLLSAIQPHTTSKISELEDLLTIGTFGFRGEALASIASVSKFSLKSKTENGVGRELSINSEGEVKNEEIAMPQGTIVEVKELFYNVPARKKFMKADPTELRNLIEVFTNIAIVNPKTAFKFSHNGRALFHMPAEESDEAYISEKRVKEILALSENDNLFGVFYEGNGISVSGFIGHPSLSTGKIHDQLVFVNRRPVQDKTTSKAVRDGYGTFISEGKYPIFVVSLTINGDLVDVNVHPRKTEVKFQDSNQVFGAVKKAVREALQKSLDFDKQAEAIVGDVDTYEEKNDVAVMRLRDSDNVFQSSRQSKSDTWKDMGVKPANQIEQSLDFTKALLDEKPAESTELDEHFEAIAESIEDIANFKAVQMHNKYLVVEAQGEIQIWDQHAAAERIRYEKLLKDYEVKGIETQALLTPITMTVSAKLVLIVEEFSEQLQKLGFEVEPFGKDALNIRAVPALLADGEIADIVKDLLQDISENSDNSEKTNDIEKNHDYYIKTLACHSSVTANMRLQPEAVNQFIKDLKACDNPYSCPHGRPIIWHIPLSELDKRFDR